MTDIRFDVRDNFSGFIAQFARGTDKEVEKATVRAINRTAVTVRAEAGRELRPSYPGMKVGIIKRQIELKRAKSGALTAELSFSGKRFRLYGNFPLRYQRGRYGTAVAPSARLPFAIVTGDNKPLTPADIRRAFLQRSRDRKTPNVFVRQGRARYPLDVVLAGSVGDAFAHLNLDRTLTRVAGQRFQSAFTAAVNFEGVR